MNLLLTCFVLVGFSMFSCVTALSATNETISINIYDAISGTLIPTTNVSAVMTGLNNGIVYNRDNTTNLQFTVNSNDTSFIINITSITGYYSLTNYYVYIDAYSYSLIAGTLKLYTIATNYTIPNEYLFTIPTILNQSCLSFALMTPSGCSYVWGTTNNCTELNVVSTANVGNGCNSNIVVSVNATDYGEYKIYGDLSNAISGDPGSASNSTKRPDLYAPQLMTFNSNGLISISGWNYQTAYTNQSIIYMLDMLVCTNLTTVYYTSTLSDTVPTQPQDSSQACSAPGGSDVTTSAIGATGATDITTGYVGTTGLLSTTGTTAILTTTTGLNTTTTGSATISGYSSGTLIGIILGATLGGALVIVVIFAILFISNATGMRVSKISRRYKNR